jgi:type VI secretion system lysozyme-like protein
MGAMRFVGRPWATAAVELEEGDVARSGHRQRGLLGRLATNSRHVDPMESVLEHLRDLLNTTVGDCLTVHDYGLDDLSGSGNSYQDACRRVQKAIQDAIRRYEPRVVNVSVRQLPRPDNSHSTLRFEVIAHLASDHGAVRIETSVLPSGQFKVED